MTWIAANPRMAALVSLALALPTMLIYTTVALDIDALERPILSVLSSDGTQPNAFGWAFMAVSVLLLPVAFVVNLLPMIRRSGPERRRTVTALNLIVAAILLFYLSRTWGEFLIEEINCRMGVPSCD